MNGGPRTASNALFEAGSDYMRVSLLLNRYRLDERPPELLLRGFISGHLPQPRDPGKELLQRPGVTHCLALSQEILQGECPLPSLGHE